MKVITITFYGPPEWENNVLTRKVLLQQTFKLEWMDKHPLMSFPGEPSPFPGVHSYELKVTDVPDVETVAGQRVSVCQ